MPELSIFREVDIIMQQIEHATSKLIKNELFKKFLLTGLPRFSFSFNFKTVLSLSVKLFKNTFPILMLLVLSAQLA